MKKKTIALLMALVLVVGVAVGGTLAYLLDMTAPVVNTFTVGNVDIDLTETDAETAVDGSMSKSFKMVPGVVLDKDPTVTVLANSEKCYVFVKIDEANNSFTGANGTTEKYVTYNVADGWTQDNGTDIPNNVWYCTQEASETDTKLAILADNQVTVNSNITKAMMGALTEDTYPKLTFTAYACQCSKDGTTAFTAAEAWAQVNPNA